ncbi:MAG: hypothetical protein N2Z21_02185 [Candidatus Sumerlaeaceae bacterium]|nr:hypothetical protein [Candidatus Sumerlaeaceae bacterium]
MKYIRTLGMLAVAAAASSSFAAINLSAPELAQGDLAGGGAKIKFTSDKAGYAVVYIMAHNVPGYNAGEIVQTIRGNMVAGLNEFRWDGKNAYMRNPNLVNGVLPAPALNNAQVSPNGVIPDGSQVILRVTAMDTSLWNADYVIGTQGPPPIGRYMALDVSNGKVFVGDAGNQLNIATNKFVHIFNAANGSNISTFAYGSIVNNAQSFEPYDIYGDPDGSYFVASRYSPAGNGSPGWIYQFDANGTLINNAVTGAGNMRSGDRLGTGASSIFYISINGSNLIRRAEFGQAATNAVSSAQVPVLIQPSAIAAVDNGANVAPVLYVGCENNNVGLLRLDWNGSGYVMNKIFAKNFWTDQNVWTWTMLNVSGAWDNLTVAGTIGTVTSGTSNGPWGNAFYGLVMANKGDVNSDVFVRTTGAVWRLRADGTSVWPGRGVALNLQGAGIDIAWDGSYLYFTAGNAAVSSYAGRWVIRDAFPDSGDVTNTLPQTFTASLLPVSTSRLTIE